MTKFKKINHGWNADPNVPEPSIKIIESSLLLTFSPNKFIDPKYNEVVGITLCFHGCTKYRLGATNDEGWAMGQCRVGTHAPWGEFYEVSGDLLLGEVEWNEACPVIPDKLQHYLFYFRDETFECQAESWSKNNVT